MAGKRLGNRGPRRRLLVEVMRAGSVYYIITLYVMMRSQSFHLASEREEHFVLGNRRRYFPKIICLELDGPCDAIGAQADAHVNNRTQRQYTKVQIKEDNHDYSDENVDLTRGECRRPFAAWQELSFPNCNSFHELDLPSQLYAGDFKYVAHGVWNNVFRLTSVDKELLVLKSLKKIGNLRRKFLPDSADFIPLVYQQQRNDGLISERLSSSRFILDTYGYCGVGTIAPFAQGGSLSNLMGRRFQKLHPVEQLRYAKETAQGLSALHSIDDENFPSVIHNDLHAGQFMIINGTLQLADFNLAVLLKRNSSSPHGREPCDLTGKVHMDRARSPEEYSNITPRTSKIDVWTLGSILYHMVTGRVVWTDLTKKKGQAGRIESRMLVANGTLPPMEDEISNSQDPVKRVLLRAMKGCYELEPRKRWNARDVALYLEESYDRLKTNAKNLSTI